MSDVVEATFEAVEPLLQVAVASIPVLPLASPHHEPAHHPDGAETGHRGGGPLRDPGGRRQPALELAQLPVEARPGRLDLRHRLSCCFAHATSSFSDSWVSSGLAGERIDRLATR